MLMATACEDDKKRRGRPVQQGACSGQLFPRPEVFRAPDYVVNTRAQGKRGGSRQYDPWPVLTHRRNGRQVQVEMERLHGACSGLVARCRVNQTSEDSEGLHYIRGESALQRTLDRPGEVVCNSGRSRKHFNYRDF